MREDLNQSIINSEAGSTQSAIENSAPPILFPQQTNSTLLPVQKGATVLESLSAGFQTEAGRSIVAAKETYQDILQKPDPYYNPFEDPLLQSKGNDYINKYVDQFKDSPNGDITVQRINKISDLERNYDIASRNGLGGMLGFLSGSVVDPSTALLFLGMGAASKASLGERMLANTALFSGQTLVSEMAAQKANPFRTQEESINNVVVAGILGGLGATVGQLKGISPSKLLKGEEGFFDSNFSKAEQSTTKKLFEGITTDKQIFSNDLDIKPLTSLTRDELASGNNKALFGDDGLTAMLQNPQAWASIKFGKLFNTPLRFATAKLPYTQELGVRMWENTYFTKGNLEGINKPFNIEEVAIAGEMSRIQPAFKKMDAAYQVYKDSKHGKLSVEEFERQALSNRRHGIKSDIPGMQSAQQSLEEFYTNYRNYLKEKGKLPKELEIPAGSKAYTTMIPDKDAIMLNFKEAKQSWSNAILKVTKDEQDKLAQEIVDFEVPIKTMTPNEMQTHADSEAQKILEDYLVQKGSKLISNASFNSPFLKKRLPIPDYMVEKFLQKDPRQIMAIYSRSMEREIAIKDVLGFNTGDDLLADIRSKYSNAINEATDPEVRKSLLAEKNSVELDTRNRLNQFLGQDESFLDKHGLGNRLISSAITLGNTGILGLNMLAQPTEMMKKYFSLLFHDKGKILQDGLEGAKAMMRPDDAALVGVGLDTKYNLAAARLTDIDDTLMHATNFDRTISKINGGYNWFTGVAWINDFMGKSLLEGLSQDTLGMIAYSLKQDMKMPTIARRFKSLSGTDKSIEIELNRIGLNDKKLQKAIIQQSKKYAKEEGGVFSLNMDQWDNTNAKIQFLARMRNELDAMRVIPSYAAKPYILNKGIGRLVGHLKGWMFGAYGQSFVPLMQNTMGVSGSHSAMAIARLATLTAAGSLVYVAKRIASGENPNDIDMRPARLFVEGFNRGGAIAMLDWVNQIADRQGFGLASALGVPTSTRFLDQSLADQLLGPSAAIGNDVYNLTGKVLRGSATADDWRKGLRHAPGYNVIYWNFLTNQYLNNKSK